jgi:hypothetical protein
MLSIKLKYQEVTRRVQLWRTSSSFQTLVGIAKEKFDICSDFIVFTYCDDEGDTIALSSDEDFTLCASDIMPDGRPKLRFTFQVIPKDPGPLLAPAAAQDVSSSKVIHESIECRGCSSKPIIGARFLCSVRPDYNVCEKCESRGQPYPMLKIYECTPHRFSIRRMPFTSHRIDRKPVPLVLESPFAQGQPVSFGDLVSAVARELFKRRSEKRAPQNLDAAAHVHLATKLPSDTVAKVDDEAKPVEGNSPVRSAGETVVEVGVDVEKLKQISPSEDATTRAETSEIEIPRNAPEKSPPDSSSSWSDIKDSDSVKSLSCAGTEKEVEATANETVFSIAKEMDSLLSSVPIAETKLNAEPSASESPLARNAAAKATETRLLISSRLISDITIPDYSVVQPRTMFTKVWLVKNEGPNDWPQGVKLVPSGGDLLCDANTAISVDSIAVGEMIQISIELTSPSKAGRYVAYFSLQGPDGSLFGQQFWVDIRITQSLVDLPSVKPKEVRKVTSSSDGLFYDVENEQMPSPKEMSKLEIDRAEWYAEIEELKNMGFFDEVASIRLLKEHTKWSLSKFPQLRGGPFRDTLPVVIDALLLNQKCKK